ncbi:hypothetical protein ATCVGM07011_341L [Acanthocystis turfacea Chlorella virus GM0701.1]|nr:hypothetical protein ATCVGM07011_341L [Acanthocystis turfacea Chlorella virus GM0701.1]
MFTLPRIPRMHFLKKVEKPNTVTARPRVVLVPQPLEKKVVWDHEITEFEVRVIFSTSILAFSMAMLATKRGDPSVYMPLITSVIGYWTPSPTRDTKDK